MDGYELAFWLIGLIGVLFGLAMLWGFIVLIKIMAERLRLWGAGINEAALKEAARSLIPSRPTRIALILGLTAIVVVWLVMHMSPYQTCIRSLETKNPDESEAALYCARQLGNR